MVPQSTVRAQYAKHNPPSHAKPWGGPAERAMKAVGLQIWTQTVLSTNRNHCSQEGKWPASEKSDTLLWSEVGRDDLFIYHLFFYYFHLCLLWKIKDRFWEKSFILHPLNIVCGIFASFLYFHEWAPVMSFHTPGGGSRKQKDFLENGANTDTSYITHPWDTNSV